MEHQPACSISTSVDELDLVLEGTAKRVRADRELDEVAGAYRTAYGWAPIVRDGAPYAEKGAPNDGPAAAKGPPASAAGRLRPAHRGRPVGRPGDPSVSAG